MPMWPTRLRMSRVRNTSRTSPLPLCMWKLWPSAVTMPAASCPRCCSTVMPSYSSWFTGLRATTPTIPHMVRIPWSRQRHHLAVEGCGLDRGERLFGSLPRRKWARAQAIQVALVLHVVRKAQARELVARVLELGLVAEGAHLHREAFQLRLRRGLRGRGLRGRRLGHGSPRGFRRDL